MVLFIRKDCPYLKKLAQYSMGGEYQNAENVSQKISDGEHVLGIKINNLTKLEADQEPTVGIPYNNIKEYLQQILITHSDVKIVKENFLNRWDIYLEGHGSADGAIAGMPRTSFEAMLDFLNPLSLPILAVRYSQLSAILSPNMVNLFLALGRYLF